MRYPCPYRGLQETNEDADSDAVPEAKLWVTIYTSLVLFGMFIALISDRLGADSVMLTALTLFMAAGIITVEEGLGGFANEGLLTVLVLFVVAEGIARTGALDWWMGNLLGRPKSVADAQLRLMIPIAIVSAFLNNTPVVAVMIPIVQRWAKTIHVSSQQLLVPLSFASILGGTCTLIGTSTNLVVVGLLEERYPDDETIGIGLFDLGRFGVPIAMLGVAYIVFASPFLLPGARGEQGSSPLEDGEDILLGARLTQWSPAAGRTVKRSGLRDTGGIYLVSVHRAATGNVHRAVSNDFVLTVGDVLYFTGLVESFGDFCEDHGLEVVTSEVDVEVSSCVGDRTGVAIDMNHVQATSDATGVSPTRNSLGPLAVNEEGGSVPLEVGVTKESLLTADFAERLRSIHRMTDSIRGEEPADNAAAAVASHHSRRASSKKVSGDDPAKIVVTIEKDLVVVGIDALDRPGLLLDISKGLLRLNLQLHHTEAAVVRDRSVSIWRCEMIETELADLEEIWSVMNALLSSESGVSAVKKRGLRVIRARVPLGSNLVDQVAGDVDFRANYDAAIVAIQKQGKNTTLPLTMVVFEVGDVLVLQVGNESPLLVKPQDGFYNDHTDSNSKPLIRTPSYVGIQDLFGKRSSSQGDLTNIPDDRVADPAAVVETLERVPINENPTAHTSAGTGNEEELGIVNHESVWGDLQVLFFDERNSDQVSSYREFLIAMRVAAKSSLVGKTSAESGIRQLPDLFLVSIERPVQTLDSPRKTKVSVVSGCVDVASVGDLSGSLRTDHQAFGNIGLDEVLADGDILWFSGPASAVGELRKIPGLISYENDEVEKINEKVFDRRLVQAVISRKGPLVGKTVKQVQFRTRYGAAVVAVHREGKRIQEHPGKVRLQAGDVLLLEAGPSFLAKSGEKDRSFALLAEVEGSAPPRLTKLIPALVLTAGMLIAFTVGWSSLLVAGLVASILMISLGILSEQEARAAVNWEVFLTIGAAFGIGSALVNSGLATSLANALVAVGGQTRIGDAGLLGSVYFATFLISNVVTNNAAAALIFPIAMEAAESTGVDRVLMSYALMLGASASFMSPFGYTTNLMIYGPGGYKYNDFLIFGTPMQLVLWLASTAFLVTDNSFWYLTWIVPAVVLLLGFALRSKAS